MRFAYIKYGDVIEELKSFGPRQSVAPTGGHGAFAGAFLKMVAGQPALIISVVAATRDEMQYTAGAVEARLYRRRPRWPGIVTAARFFLRLLRFHPDVIICTQDGWPQWAAFVAAKIMGAAFIHSRQRAVRLAGDNWRRRLIATVDARTIRRADAVICHGPFTRSQLLSIGVPEARIGEFDISFED